MMPSLTLSSDRPDPRLIPYLTTDGSLTALLEAHAKRPLSVQILSEVLTPISRDQKQALGLPLHRPAIAKVRTSLLYGDSEHPWVRAVSVFCLAHLKSDAKRLLSLGSTPIGYVLFKKQRTLPYQRLIYQDSTNAAQPNWVRQTVYDWHGCKVLVSECFLDAFVQSLPKQAVHPKPHASPHKAIRPPNRAPIR